MHRASVPTLCTPVNPFLMDFLCSARPPRTILNSWARSCVGYVTEDGWKCQLLGGYVGMDGARYKRQGSIRILYIDISSVKYP